MPREPVASDLLPALAAALAPVRDAARDGADEVLAHYPDLGDREAQSALEQYLEQAADLLREVEASAVDLMTRIGVGGGPAGPAGSVPERAAAARASRGGGR
jgi:hypothetical protein